MRIMLAFFERFINMSGGIERVCCNMANAMTQRGHEVSIVYCYGKSGKPFYTLDRRVKMYNLMEFNPKKWSHNSLSQCVSGFDKMVREGLRIFSKNRARNWNESCKGRLIQQEAGEVINVIKPDVIISFRYETGNYLLHFVHVKEPVITMFHMNPEVMLPNAPEGELKTIEESSCTQVLLKRDISLVKNFCPRAHVVCIPNAVPQYKGQASLSEKKKTYTIINVARLHKSEKRQHLLVEAFAKLAHSFPDWQVELWGGGNESGAEYVMELKDLIHKHHLENQVFLKGESTHIIDEYVKSDIFCFPSANEGFPLAMTEAMSAGLPVVGFRSCKAVAELVEDGKTGILVENGVEALAQGLKILMDDSKMRAEMGAEARVAMKDFSPEIVWNKWEQLLNEVVNKC